MKKIFALPLAVLFFAACSESTAPNATANLTPRYAKPGSGSGVTVNGTRQNILFTFGSGDYTATNTIGTATLVVADPNAIATAGGAAQTELAPTWADGYVLGRLNKQQVTISIAAGATNYSISFDFFAIGSWDGKGQQAQHGAFGQDSWQIAAVCGGTLVDIFTTSFSNQKTVQQNYPRSIYDGGGTQWLSGSEGSNVTGFNANVPLFSSVVDSWYKLSFSGANPCGNRAFTAINILIPGFDLQSRFDESWAIDNLLLKTD